MDERQIQSTAINGSIQKVYKGVFTKTASGSQKGIISEGKKMLRQKVEEIVSYNSSRAQKICKEKGETSGGSMKERRARCFICKKRGHVLWKCPNKKNKIRSKEPNKIVKPLIVEKVKYPEKVHVIADYMVEGTDDETWNEVWYVSNTYKHHMCPRRMLFKRLQYKFKMIGKEENEKKFIFSYGLGDATVKTRDGDMVFLMKEGQRNHKSKDYEEGYGPKHVVSEHNKFLDDYFESIDPSKECSLIKGIEVLKMDEGDDQDYIDDEYLSMNGTLYAMKVAKLLGLTQDDEQAVKECYKEYIGMVKIYYEEAQRSKQEEPGIEVVGNSSGTAHVKKIHWVGAG
ncbi:ARID DNA-binding domain-containing protein [Tanacetum coccineum]